MAIFTTIELAGSIMTGNTGQGTTKGNFLTFTKSNYMPVGYHQVAELLYGIFRCGVGHSYISKGAALLSSNFYDKSKHLNCYRNGLFIYVPQLARDLRSAILRLYQDIKSTAALRANYNQVIQQLDDDGRKAYQDFLSRTGGTVINRTIKRDIVTTLT